LSASTVNCVYLVGRIRKKKARFTSLERLLSASFLKILVEEPE